MLPFLDLSVIRENPKVFLGYSDSTILYGRLRREGRIAALHGRVRKPSPLRAGAVLVDFTKLRDGGWSGKRKELIPSYGQSLSENAALCRRVRAATAAVLKHQQRHRNGERYGMIRAYRLYTGSDGNCHVDSGSVSGGGSHRLRPQMAFNQRRALEARLRGFQGRRGYSLRPGSCLVAAGRSSLQPKEERDD